MKLNVGIFATLDHIKNMLKFKVFRITNAIFFVAEQFFFQVLVITSRKQRMAKVRGWSLTFLKIKI